MPSTAGETAAAPAPLPTAGTAPAAGAASSSGAAPPSTAVTLPTATSTPAPPCLYLLADHLDAVLASGEDLLAIAVDPRAVGDVAGAAAIGRADVRNAVERIRTLELRMLARAIKARERAVELARIDHRFAMPSRLFIGGTGALADAVNDCADTAVADFETGDALPAYLRSRGLLDARQCHLPDDAALAIGEDFLVAGRIPLGALLDLVAAFLDALELHEDLFVDDPAGAADPSEGAEKADAGIPPASADPVAPVAAGSECVAAASD